MKICKKCEIRLSDAWKTCPNCKSPLTNITEFEITIEGNNFNYKRIVRNQKDIDDVLKTIELNIGIKFKSLSTFSKEKRHNSE